MNVPNKPMVPTTDSAPAEPARRSGRRHIGQPLWRRTDDRGLARNFDTASRRQSLALWGGAEPAPLQFTWNA